LDNIQANRDNDLILIRRTLNKTDTTSNNNKYNVFVYGTKERLNPSTQYTEETKYIKTPLTYDVAGCMARTNRIAESFNSPAGFKRGTIKSAVRMPDAITTSEASVLSDNNINFVLSFPNQGIVLFSDKTASGEKIGSINLLLMLTQEIGKISRNSLFEVNTSSTRENFTVQAEAFMQSLLVKQAISNYSVICDESNNTQSDIELGKFNAQVNYTAINSVEEITLIFTDTLGQE
jgi:phage tail sheath protein FI